MLRRSADLELFPLADVIVGMVKGIQTSGNIDIHGYDSIASANNRITVMVITTAIGTTSHTDDPTRVRHLVVHLSESGSHLICQCACHDHDIRLPRRCSENDSKTVLVISGGRKMHHLNCTAGETEGHGPQRTLAGPVSDLVKRGTTHESV